MFPFLKIILLILQSFPQAFFNPFFWIVIFIVYWQYNRSAQLQEKMFGSVKIKPLEMVMHSVFYGCIGGIIGSLVVVFLGVSISEAGLIYVWPLALLLMLVHPRYMCFSYAAGILSLFSLILGFPKIDVAGLMALVAVLHLVESLLIYFSGHINAVPVFMKDKDHGLVGGFSLQEFWPVPIILLVIMTAQIPVQGIVEMPDWWPLIRPPEYIINNENTLFMMFPVVAALGYGDIALSRTPKLRCKASALNLSIFSATLMLLAVLASRYKLFAFLAALFAPIGHEMLIILGKKSEKQRKPLFDAPLKGERVLDVIKGSPADRLSLGPGDIILQVNGKDIVQPGDLEEVLSDFPTFVWIKAKTPQGEIKNAEMKAYPDGVNTLGAILVPRGENVPCIVMEEIDNFYFLKSFIKWLKKFKKK